MSEVAFTDMNRSAEENDMGRELVEYFVRDDEIKELTKLQDEIKSHAKEFAHSTGMADSRGSIKVELPEGKIQLIVRESVSLDEEKTLEFLQSHGFDGAVYSKPCVDEEMLAALFREGSISVDDMRDLIVRKSNVALYIKRPKAKEERRSDDRDKGVLSSIFAALEV